MERNLIPYIAIRVVSALLICASARHWGRNSKAMYRLVRSIMTVFGLRRRRRDATLIRFMPNQKI